MNQTELALEKCEDDFDFFNTNFKKPINQIVDKKELKNDVHNHNSPKILVLKLLLILIMPGLIFTAINAGTYLADTLWDTATGKRFDKVEQTQQIPYFTYITNRHKLDK